MACFWAHKKWWKGDKEKIMTLFKTNTTKNYSKLTCVKNKFGDWKKPRKEK